MPDKSKNIQKIFQKMPLPEREAWLAYLSGDIEQSSVHEIEQKIASDPFYAEALEGYEASKLSASQLAQVLAEIDQKTRPAKKKRFFITYQRSLMVAGVAASFLLLFMLGIYWLDSGLEQGATSSKQANAPSESQAISPDDSLISDATTPPSSADTPTADLPEEAASPSAPAHSESPSAPKQKHLERQADQAEKATRSAPIGPPPSQPERSARPTEPAKPATTQMDEDAFQQQEHNTASQAQQAEEEMEIPVAMPPPTQPERQQEQNTETLRNRQGNAPDSVWPQANDQPSSMAQEYTQARRIRRQQSPPDDDLRRQLAQAQAQLKAQPNNQQAYLKAAYFALQLGRTAKAKRHLRQLGKAGLAGAFPLSQVMELIRVKKQQEALEKIRPFLD